MDKGDIMSHQIGERFLAIVSLKIGSQEAVRIRGGAFVDFRIHLLNLTVPAGTEKSRRRRRFVLGIDFLVKTAIGLVITGCFLPHRQEECLVLR